MDIDALKITRAHTWDRLGDLAKRSVLTGPEIDELSALYQVTTRDLAAIRASQADPDVVRFLSRDLAVARAKLTGTRLSAGYVVSRWFRIALPAALYEARWWTISSMLFFLTITAIHAAYLLMNPEYFAAIGTPSELENIARVRFVQYYYQDTNVEFASSVWVNNSYIAARALGLGITGVGPLWVLYENAENTGIMAAIVFKFAGVWHFFRYILPHGMPELTAVFISAGAGMRIFWALLVPGRYSRAQSLARVGRAMVTIVMGMVILLFFCGLLEGFVTPSPLPDWLRLGLGVVLTILVWVYTLVPGRMAHQAGYIGDINAEQAGYIRRAN